MHLPPRFIVMFQRTKGRTGQSYEQDAEGGCHRVSGRCSRAYSGPADTRSRSVSPGESGSLTELCWAADANAETPQPRADGLALSFFQPNYRIDDEES